MSAAWLPPLIALCNATALVFLCLGRWFIARKRVAAHRAAMLSAFAASTLFLAFYVTHKVVSGHTLFHGRGMMRGLYLAVLATHIPLAMTVPVLALLLIGLAWTGRLDAHRRVARIAWPVWIYVSVTGVLIYILLYHLNPAG